MTKKINKYIRLIKYKLPVSRREKSLFCDDIRNSINQYIYNNQGSTFDDIINEFGTVDEIVNSFTEANINIINKKIKMNKILKIIIPLSAIALVASIIFLLYQYGGKIFITNI